jgi:hemerythrin-like domain-containing protein
MRELGWSAPETRVDAGSALKGILAQHREIRDLLERSRAMAAAALDGERVPADRLATSIGDIRTIMEVHLAFEEKVLLPLLDDDLPLGPARAAALLDEHHQQRQLLATLHAEATAGPSLPQLAEKLDLLTSWLLEDMDEEERCVLIPDVIRDDIVVVDQSCG